MILKLIIEPKFSKESSILEFKIKDIFPVGDNLIGVELSEEDLYIDCKTFELLQRDQYIQKLRNYYGKDKGIALKIVEVSIEKKRVLFETVRG